MIILDNKPDAQTRRELALLKAGIERLRLRLPPDWQVELLPQMSRGQADSPIPSEGPPRIRLMAPDRRWAELQVVGTPRLDPRRVRTLVGIPGTPLAQGPALAVAPYLSQATQQELRAHGISYVDLTGNIWLSVRKPGICIDVAGARQEPDREDRPARTLKGQKAASLFRLLIDRQTPPGVRTLALEAGVDPGYVSRVLRLLDDEALVDRSPRGTLQRVDWEKLLRRWAQESPFAKRGTLTTWIDPRGVAALFGRLGSAHVRYAVTGGMAAHQWAPVAGTRLLTLYTEDAPALARDLGLRPAEIGANVVLMEPRDGYVFRGSELRGGICHVAPSQVAADLLTSPGRGPAEAESLIEWMRTNQEAWRA